MKIKTRIKAGLDATCPRWGCGTNHNQTMVRGLKIKTNVKAGESTGDLRVGH